jgi:hypothetical protein
MFDKLENLLSTLAHRHPLSILFIGPLLGFAFVIFLPALGFYLVGREIWLHTAGGIRRAANSRANLMRIYRRR